MGNSDVLLPETVFSAAVRSTKGTVFVVDRPGRHDKALRLLYDSGEDPRDEDQGFVTSLGRFVDRVEGADLAISAGQIVELKWPPLLYSEDLW